MTTTETFALFFAIFWGELANVQPRFKAFLWSHMRKKSTFWPWRILSTAQQRFNWSYMACYQRLQFSRSSGSGLGALNPGPQRSMALEER